MDVNSEKNGYEKKDVKAWTIIGSAVAVIVFLVIVIIVLNDYFIAAKEEMVYNVYLKPESTLIRDIRASETEVLTTYKVINAEMGIYRVPIERAMKLLAEEQFRKGLRDR